MSKKEYPIRTCKVCSKEFKPHVHNQIYCCEECYKIGTKINQKKPDKYKICPICGKEFKLTVYNKIYCSIECRQKSDNKPVKSRICEFCGKEFIPNANGQKYCCKRCLMDATNLRERKGIIPKKCKMCNKIFNPIYPNEKYCNNCKTLARKENKKIYSKQYYSKNKDKILANNREYSNNNKDKIKKYQDLYKQTRNKKRRLRRKNDINYQLTELCRDYLRRCLTAPKSKRTFDILGYTTEQLKQRLEIQFHNGMTWDNRGKYWEIHHKKELCKFNFVLLDGTPDYNQIRLANSLANLQPLTIEEHKLKTKELKTKI